MERPIAIVDNAPDGATPPHIASRQRPAIAGLDTTLLAWVFSARILVELAVLVAQAWAADRSAIQDEAVAALARTVAAAACIIVLFSRIDARAPARIHDRSHRGLAWSGAADAIISQCFLGGGAIAVATLFLAPEALVATRFGGASTALLMLTAFGTIAIAPIAEELVARGASFAVARRHLTTPASATLAVGVGLAWNADLIAASPATLLPLSVVGALAIALRLRHAALGPAIALHCGYAFTTTLAQALA